MMEGPRIRGVHLRDPARRGEPGLRGYTRARCYSSLQFVAPIGIIHINENGLGAMTEGPRRSRASAVSRASRDDVPGGGHAGLTCCRRSPHRSPRARPHCGRRGLCCRDAVVLRRRARRRADSEGGGLRYTSGPPRGASSPQPASGRVHTFLYVKTSGGLRGYTRARCYSSLLFLVTIGILRIEAIGEGQ
jgi:hypothetical protein